MIKGRQEPGRFRKRAGVETASQTRIEGVMQQHPQPTAVLPHHGGGGKVKGKEQHTKGSRMKQKQYNLTMIKKKNWREKKESCQIERKLEGTLNRPAIS